ncbi:hypothetical protein GQ457_05G026070 [Hibiscus cannabinus]
MCLKRRNGGISIVFLFPGERWNNLIRVLLCPQGKGVWKFNVDDLTRGKLALFSGPIGILDSNVAEPKVIDYTLNLLHSLSWGLAHSVIIEPDSVADTLAKGVDSANWLCDGGRS